MWNSTQNLFPSLLEFDLLSLLQYKVTGLRREGAGISDCFWFLFKTDGSQWPSGVWGAACPPSAWLYLFLSALILLRFVYSFTKGIQLVVCIVCTLDPCVFSTRGFCPEANYAICTIWPKVICKQSYKRAIESMRKLLLSWWFSRRLEQPSRNQHS